MFVTSYMQNIITAWLISAFIDWSIFLLEGIRARSGVLSLVLKKILLRRSQNASVGNVSKLWIHIVVSE